MNKLFIAALLIAAISIIFIFKNQEESVMDSEVQANTNHKVLVAYFSRTGEQYGVGNITEGNSAIIAKMIAKKTGGDLFEIKVKDDKYPTTYKALVQYAKEEKEKNARPKLADSVSNFDSYDTVFIGYPNWWGDMPMSVYTFLDSYNFDNKKVYHFCTHEGSGGVKHEGFAIYGHVAQNDRVEADKKVSDWLSKLGF